MSSVTLPDGITTTELVDGGATRRVNTATGYAEFSLAEFDDSTLEPAVLGERRRQQITGHPSELARERGRAAADTAGLIPLGSVYQATGPWAGVDEDVKDALPQWSVIRAQGQNHQKQGAGWVQI